MIRILPHHFRRTVMASLGALCVLAGGHAWAQRPDAALVASFVEDMSSRHGFEREALMRVMGEARQLDTVLRAISRPAEAKPWHEYRPIFVTEARERAGVEFWRRNARILGEAERVYGVPPEVIAAIIGVETFYGRRTGDFRVIDALSTLAFAYPQRAEFFRSELEQFLLLAREQNLSPLALTGSYAGAMGIPQFIASSYRAYAVDFDEDGLIDIWEDPADAIGSVANYLARHGWCRGDAIAVPARLEPRARPPQTGLEPELALEEAIAAGLEPARALEGEPAVSVIELEAREGLEYWLGLRNFYVITRYNHSALYAMAVLQLAQGIRAAYERG